jgi:GNAT superfamily N-acetyltransferase
MRAADLVALEHENWIAYLTGAVSCTSGAKVTREGGVVTILSGLPMDWFDQVLIELQEATPAALLAAVATARQSGHRFVVRLREGLDDRFIPTIMRAGLIRAGPAASATGMVAFPIDPDAIQSHRTRGLAIRRVTDAASIEEHREVSTAGFGSDPMVARGTACSALLARPECDLYLGYQWDAPVVSGLGWRTGRTIGVFSIATIESARRRGYGAAMTARVMADGVAAGCDVAALQASEMGRPIYERLGFRTVVRYTAYTDLATDLPA